MSLRAKRSNAANIRIDAPWSDGDEIGRLADERGRRARYVVERQGNREEFGVAMFLSNMNSAQNQIVGASQYDSDAINL